MPGHVPGIFRLGGTSAAMTARMFVR
jgi:hypothetical protein